MGLNVPCLGDDLQGAGLRSVNLGCDSTGDVVTVFIRANGYPGGYSAVLRLILLGRVWVLSLRRRQ